MTPEVRLFAARATLIALLTASLASSSEAKVRPSDEEDRPARDLAEAGLKGDRASEPRLLRALDGPKGKSRYAAIRSLGLLRSKAAAARLAALAKSKDAGERELALDALARTGVPEAAPPPPRPAASRLPAAGPCSGSTPAAEPLCARPWPARGPRRKPPPLSRWRVWGAATAWRRSREPLETRARRPRPGREAAAALDSAPWSRPARRAQGRGGFAGAAGAGRRSEKLK